MQASPPINPRSAYSADGTPITWYDFGGHGPDLLLAHATGFCAMVWAPVVEYLQQAFHCYAYDMRGHGLSGRPGNGRDGWDWARYADDASAVITAGGLSDCFGVGHSSGGATQLLLEEARPGLFRGLHLFEPVLFPVVPPSGPDPERDLAIRARKRRAVFESREAALSAYRERGPFTNFDPGALEAYVHYGFARHPDGTLTLRCHPNDEAEIYVMASAHTGYSNLPAVKCAVTVARGSDSVAFSHEDVSAVAARLPNGRLVEVEGASHFGPLEMPEQFAQAVISDFNSPGRTPPGGGSSHTDVASPK